MYGGTPNQRAISSTPNLRVSSICACSGVGPSPPTNFAPAVSTPHVVRVAGALVTLVEALAQRCLLLGREQARHLDAERERGALPEEAGRELLRGDRPADGAAHELEDGDAAQLAREREPLPVQVLVGRQRLNDAASAVEDLEHRAGTVCRLFRRATRSGSIGRRATGAYTSGQARTK